MGYVSEMAYLYTERANANFAVKGLRFDSYLQGRTWIGFASVAQPIASAALSYPQIKEISEEQFETLKKNKQSQSQASLTVSPDPTRPITAQPVAVEEQPAGDLLMVGDSDG